MSTTGRSSESAAAASDVAAALCDADLVRLVAAADGDALAATGLLATTLAVDEIAFQASVRRIPRVGLTQETATDADVTVTIGAPGGDVALTSSPASHVAYEAASEMGGDPDPVLALAGVVAAGHDPGAFDIPLRTVTEEDIGRHAGIATPTTDLVDGLAHTTLAHASFSGDVDATRNALRERDIPPSTTATAGGADGATGDAAGDGEGPADETADGTGGRRIASLLALATVGGGSQRAAEAVERALRPYAPAGTFATVEGYADVLDAVARERPGTGVALVLDTDVSSPDRVLDLWRGHARRAHRALADLDTGRYDGFTVGRPTEPDSDVPVGTVARLLRDFGSPEPVSLVLAGEEGATAAVDIDIAPAMTAAARSVDAAATSRTTTAYAKGIDDHQAFITAFREAL